MSIRMRCDTRPGWRMAYSIAEQPAPGVAEDRDRVGTGPRADSIDVINLRSDRDVVGPLAAERTSAPALVVEDETEPIRQPVELREQVGVVEVRTTVDQDDRRPAPDVPDEELAPVDRQSRRRAAALHDRPYAGVPRSAYGPAWSTRTRTRPTMSVRRRRRGGRACSGGFGRTPSGPSARAPASSCSCERGGVIAVDEDLDLAAEPGLVALEPDRLLERQQLVQPAPLVVRRDVVGEARRGRAGPLASTRPRRPGRSGRARAGGASTRTAPRSRRRSRR